MNQFEKRKARAEAAIKEKREKIRGDSVVVETPVEPVVATPSELTHEGFDICLSADGRKYQGVCFKYNPVTMEVKIESITPIQRQVALVFENQKIALKTLLRKK